MKTLIDNKDFSGVVLYWTPMYVAFQKIIPSTMPHAQVQVTEYYQPTPTIKERIPGLKNLRWHASEKPHAS